MRFTWFLQLSLNAALRQRRNLVKCIVLHVLKQQVNRSNKTCVCETRLPPAATKSKYGKISKYQISTQPHPQGHVMSVKCEQPLDEHTVQVWLLYDHPNFKYCTLFASGTELQTDRRTI